MRLPLTATITTIKAITTITAIAVTTLPPL
jgi:hypothetical protein